MFRPSSTSKRFIMRMRLKIGRSESFSFRSRVQWYPAGWKSNHQTIGKTFKRLHYLACHAPVPIQKKWQGAYSDFCAKYFASKGKSSVQYLNKYTAHRWL